MRKFIITALTTGLALSAVSLPVNADKRIDTGWIKWAAKDGGNNHFYRMIGIDNPISWGFAVKKSFRLNPNSHLATLTTEEENNFVFDLVASVSMERVWLGGVQIGNPPDHTANWRWITGEEWIYTNWSSGQPGVDTTSLFEF